MRRSKGLVGMTFLVFVAGACFAQVKSRNSHELLTRISYRSTYGVDWREQKSSPQICFALYRDGHYRLSRMTEAEREDSKEHCPTTCFRALAKY